MNAEFNPTMRYKSGGDIRLIMTTSCQSGCDFCHLEGNTAKDKDGTLNPILSDWMKRSKSLPLVERLTHPFRVTDVPKVAEVAKKIGNSHVHLTGGEPTIHPEIVEIISAFKQSGVVVGMTTNGEIAPKIFKNIMTSGIDKINFSLHALTCEEYLAMDLIAQGLARNNSHDIALNYAATRLKNKQTNLEAAAEYSATSSLKIAANTVVRDADTTINIIKLCHKLGIKCRLQRNLNHKDASDIVLGEVITRSGAQLISIDKAIGDSSGSGKNYISNFGNFRVKEFGEIYIPNMCDQCPLKGTDECREKFYGLRIENGQVGTCLDVATEGKTRFSIDEFLLLTDKPGSVPHEISQSYKNMSTNIYP